VETWEGLDLVLDWKSNVLVPYHRVSFTSQYAQLFASLQNCMCIVLNARHLYCLLICKFTYLLQCKCMRPVLFYINSFNLNVAIHGFGTVLMVERLEKCLGLGLARSWSRYHLMGKIRRLALVSWNSRKVLVSVSSRTKNRMSRSRKLRSCLVLIILFTCSHSKLPFLLPNSSYSYSVCFWHC